MVYQFHYGMSVESHSVVMLRIDLQLFSGSGLRQGLPICMKLLWLFIQCLLCSLLKLSTVAISGHLMYTHIP